MWAENEWLRHTEPLRYSVNFSCASERLRLLAYTQRASMEVFIRDLYL